MTDAYPHISGDAIYRYPEAGDLPCPPATKCLILTRYGICVIGVWGPDALAWAPLPSRNREKEERIHAVTRTHQ